MCQWHFLHFIFVLSAPPMKSEERLEVWVPLQTPFSLWYWCQPCRNVTIINCFLITSWVWESCLSCFQFLGLVFWIRILGSGLYPTVWFKASPSFVYFGQCFQLFVLHLMIAFIYIKKIILNFAIVWTPYVPYVPSASLSMRTSGW